MFAKKTNTIVPVVTYIASDIVPSPFVMESYKLADTISKQLFTLNGTLSSLVEGFLPGIPGDASIVAKCFPLGLTQAHQRTTLFSGWGPNQRFVGGVLLCSRVQTLSSSFLYHQNITKMRSHLQ